MRTDTRFCVAAAALVLLAPLAAGAQPQGDTLTPQQMSLACAPPPLLVTGGSALHVTGAQDTVPRSIFSERDFLVIDGGTGTGVQVGQRFFARRPAVPAMYTGGPAGRSVETTGWLRIVAVNETAAIATLDHVCTYVQSGDYLEPFVPLDAPEARRDVARPADLDFTTLSHVLYGPGEQSVASAGGYMTIDRGAEQGLKPGARFAIYRDVPMWVEGDRGPEMGHLPLAVIGEAVVVSAGQQLSVLRIESARDAVQRGDYAVPRKQ